MVYIPESSGFLIGIILGCLIVGALYGLIPFFVGRRRDMNGLGAAGLICSMLGNLFFMGWGFFEISIWYMLLLLFPFSLRSSLWSKADRSGEKNHIAKAGSLWLLKS